MHFLYVTGLLALRLIYRVAAIFNPKAHDFVTGRKSQEETLRKSFPTGSTEPLIWVHCASVGEFEQGRPVIEALKGKYPSLRVLITFFSPSGFSLRRKYAHADYVFYLPWDTRKNARWFAKNVHPAIAIFVKYEFWHHYATELAKEKIPLISVSTILRPDQVYFKPYGGFFRKILKSFDYFFVQNDETLQLLHGIGIRQAVKAGDTRFDRVHQIIGQATELPLASAFKNQKPTLVVGSAWPQDMEVLYPFINEHKDEMKFIVAPHEINDAFLHDIEKSMHARCVRYSAANPATAREASVMLIDNIGLLSTLYRYGEYAFVGGGYSQGLHNILEATTYGIPVFFGNKAYQKYHEATELISRGGAFEVGDYLSFKNKFTLLHQNRAQYQLASDVCRQYTEENLGATKIIAGYCEKILDAWKAS